MHFEIPPILVWLVIIFAVTGTTYVAAHLLFVRANLRVSNWSKILAGALGGAFPAAVIAFGSTVTGFEPTAIDRAIVMFAAMAFWGTTFGGLLAHAIVSRMPLVEPIKRETFE